MSPPQRYTCLIKLSRTVNRWTNIETASEESPVAITSVVKHAYSPNTCTCNIFSLPLPMHAARYWIFLISYKWSPRLLDQFSPLEPLTTVVVSKTLHYSFVQGHAENWFTLFQHHQSYHHRHHHVIALCVPPQPCEFLEQGHDVGGSVCSLSEIIRTIQTTHK